eukprot:TRINITY_DN33589_c0_g1_i1.p1 TRINITY_DN33589_c0_g1~~TRINITY_DN33589_c0_g1_i1.p1  ORF type:complete len:733 (+),score=123.90 TRINITY_DN33589_c0_g1_i1:192-2201(+)
MPPRAASPRGASVALAPATGPSANGYMPAWHAVATDPVSTGGDAAAATAAPASPSSLLPTTDNLSSWCRDPASFDMTPPPGPRAVVALPFQPCRGDGMMASLSPRIASQHGSQPHDARLLHSQAPRGCAVTAQSGGCPASHSVSSVGGHAPPIIAIDVDEVLVCYVEGFRKWLQRELPGVQLPHQELFQEAHNTMSPWRIKFALEGGLDNLEAVPGADEALHRLRAAGARLEVVTSRPPTMRESTEALLQRLFPRDTFSAFHFVGPGQKGKTCLQIGALALVDDQIPNTVDVLGCGLLPVLFNLDGSYPWSACHPEDLPQGVRCTFNWRATCDYLVSELQLIEPRSLRSSPEIGIAATRTWQAVADVALAPAVASEAISPFASSAGNAAEHVTLNSTASENRNLVIPRRVPDERTVAAIGEATRAANAVRAEASAPAAWSASVQVATIGPTAWEPAAGSPTELSTVPRRQPPMGEAAEAAGDNAHRAPASHETPGSPGSSPRKLPSSEAVHAALAMASQGSASKRWSVADQTQSTCQGHSAKSPWPEQSELQEDDSDSPRAITRALEVLAETETLLAQTGKVLQGDCMSKAQGASNGVTAKAETQAEAYLGALEAEIGTEDLPADGRESLLQSSRPDDSSGLPMPMEVFEDEEIIKDESQSVFEYEDAE